MTRIRVQVRQHQCCILTWWARVAVGRRHFSWAEAAVGSIWAAGCGGGGGGGGGRRGDGDSGGALLEAAPASCDAGGLRSRRLWGGGTVGFVLGGGDTVKSTLN